MEKCNGISVGRQIVITGHNPENAEPGNPSGAYYANAYMATAFCGDGYVYNHFKTYDNEEECQKLVNEITDVILNGDRELNKEYWTYDRLAYGSKAYVRCGGEEELIRLEMEEERNGYY